jgi:hypothetical protein
MSEREPTDQMPTSDLTGDQGDEALSASLSRHRDASAGNVDAGTAASDGGADASSPSANQDGRVADASSIRRANL